MLLNMLKLSIGKKKAFFPLTKFLLNFFLIVETLLNYLGIKKKIYE